MSGSDPVGSGCQGDGSYMVPPKAKPPLRAPNEETINRLRNATNGSVGTNEDQQLSPGKSNKPLSVSAESFVPKFQSRALNVTAPEFVPRLSVYQPTPDEYEYNFVMTEFNKTVEILTSQPGNMTEYMRRLCEYLEHVNNTSILQSIIESLYSQCISEPNFRYTGAKMCQYISLNLKQHPIFQQFRSSLLSRCKKDFDEIDALLINNQAPKAQGLAMFVSELFLNLEVQGADGIMRKFDILAVSLNNMMLSFLAQPSKDNIKCTVQMLKLSGASIDDILQTSKQYTSLDSVFERLSQLQNDPEVHENAKFMIKSVMDLRSNNWGRGESVSSTDGLADSVQGLNLSYSVLETEPVFYNANGQAISRQEAGYQNEADDVGSESECYLLNEEEELEFFQWQQENEHAFANAAEYNPNAPEYNNAGYPPWSYEGDNMDPEYTPEVMDAYEDFLKNS